MAVVEVPLKKQVFMFHVEDLWYINQIQVTN